MCEYTDILWEDGNMRGEDSQPCNNGGRGGSIELHAKVCQGLHTLAYSDPWMDKRQEGPSPRAFRGSVVWLALWFGTSGSQNHETTFLLQTIELVVLCHHSLTSKGCTEVKHPLLGRAGVTYRPPLSAQCLLLSLAIALWYIPVMHRWILVLWDHPRSFRT